MTAVRQPASHSHALDLSPEIQLSLPTNISTGASKARICSVLDYDRAHGLETVAEISEPEDGVDVDWQAYAKSMALNSGAGLLFTPDSHGNVPASVNQSRRVRGAASRHVVAAKVRSPSLGPLTRFEYEDSEEEQSSDAEEKSNVECLNVWLHCFSELSKKQGSPVNDLFCAPFKHSGKGAQPSKEGRNEITALLGSPFEIDKDLSLRHGPAGPPVVYNEAPTHPGFTAALNSNSSTPSEYPSSEEKSTGPSSAFSDYSGDDECASPRPDTASSYSDRISFVDHGSNVEDLKGHDVMIAAATTSQKTTGLLLRGLGLGLDIAFNHDVESGSHAPLDVDLEAPWLDPAQDQSSADHDLHSYVPDEKVSKADESISFSSPAQADLVPHDDVSAGQLSSLDPADAKLAMESSPLSSFPTPPQRLPFSGGLIADVDVAVFEDAWNAFDMAEDKNAPLSGSRPVANSERRSIRSSPPFSSDLCDDDDQMFRLPTLVIPSPVDEFEEHPLNDHDAADAADSVRKAAPQLSLDMTDDGEKIPTFPTLAVPYSVEEPDDLPSEDSGGLTSDDSEDLRTEESEGYVSDGFEGLPENHPLDDGHDQTPAKTGGDQPFGAAEFGHLLELVTFSDSIRRRGISESVSMPALLPSKPPSTAERAPGAAPGGVVNRARPLAKASSFFGAVSETDKRLAARKASAAKPVPKLEPEAGVAGAQPSLSLQVPAQSSRTTGTDKASPALLTDISLPNPHPSPLPPCPSFADLRSASINLRCDRPVPHCCRRPYGRQPWPDAKVVRPSASVPVGISLSGLSSRTGKKGGQRSVSGEGSKDGVAGPHASSPFEPRPSSRLRKTPSMEQVLAEEEERVERVGDRAREPRKGLRRQRSIEEEMARHMRAVNDHPEALVVSALYKTPNRRPQQAHIVVNGRQNKIEASSSSQQGQKEQGGAAKAAKKPRSLASYFVVCRMGKSKQTC